MEHAGADRAVILGMGWLHPACLFLPRDRNAHARLCCMDMESVWHSVRRIKTGGQPANSLLADQCEMIRKTGVAAVCGNACAVAGKGCFGTGGGGRLVCASRQVQAKAAGAVSVGGARV